MFKLVHYEAHAFGKQAVCILLECFIVFLKVYMLVQLYVETFFVVCLDIGNFQYQDI